MKEGASTSRCRSAFGSGETSGRSAVCLATMQRRDVHAREPSPPTWPPAAQKRRAIFQLVGAQARHFGRRGPQRLRMPRGRRKGTRVPRSRRRRRRATAASGGRAPPSGPGRVPTAARRRSGAGTGGRRRPRAHVRAPNPPVLAALAAERVVGEKAAGERGYRGTVVDSGLGLRVGGGGAGSWCRVSLG